MKPKLAHIEVCHAVSDCLFTKCIWDMHMWLSFITDHCHRFWRSLQGLLSPFPPKPAPSEFQDPWYRHLTSAAPSTSGAHLVLFDFFCSNSLFVLNNYEIVLLWISKKVIKFENPNKKKSNSTTCAPEVPHLWYGPPWISKKEREFFNFHGDRVYTR